jgi:NADH:ubiquinone oxidoreductase subunit F (NADH-binding)
LKPDNIPHLVEEHFLKGRPVKNLMWIPPKEKTPVPKISDIPFYKDQMLIALRNRGIIDPKKIDNYIARDGYSALGKVLTTMKPEEVIKTIIASGLRGRGGGGFPAGVKWQSARKALTERNERPYVIYNADEEDPGAYMDRSIIESDPHAILEGMIIGSYAMGATQGYVCIRK